MPTKGTEGHDAGRPEGVPSNPSHDRDTDHPGYETQDVNVGGIITFLGGLSAFVLIFFLFCFVMGKGINYWLSKQDGEPNKWQAQRNANEPGYTPRGEKREDLASNAALEQRQLASMTQAFPTPRLQTDDGNQDTADLHAKEDLLLNFYSTSADLPSGAVRIPIDRAMELIVQRGLPQPSAAAASPTTLMAGEHAPIINQPLTDGFARTGYELDTIEARNQKLEYGAAEAKK